ncbi:hypothetical protein ACIBQ5_11195 [Streptomyces massasporeus]|uniref:hypothetical protein n=1 Tax=Streptomyces massasporeus TaxID=67324 RepID=UPI00378A494B
MYLLPTWCYFLWNLRSQTPGVHDQGEAPLRTDPTTLDTDQVVFLSTANALDTVLHEGPEKSPEDDLAAHRAWAGQVHDVLGQQIEALRGHSWPAGARKPVADLVEDMEGAREEWRRASTARDVDTYFAHSDKAYGSVDGPVTVTARKALALGATPPASGEDERSTSEAQV